MTISGKVFSLWHVLFPTHNWIALFPIDSVGFGMIPYGYSNVFSIRPQIILYNFYLVLLLLMQCIYRLCSLYGIYRPLFSYSFIGSYMVTAMIRFLILAVCCPFNCRKMITPSSVYFPTSFFHHSQSNFELESFEKYLFNMLFHL